MSDKFDPSRGDAAARTPLTDRRDEAPSSAGAPGEDALPPWEAGPSPEDEPLPWDRELPPEDPDAPRRRHDAFTDARKSVLLRALVKTGCILDACRLAGVAPRTVYRHQERDPAFAENCRIAIRMSATPVEITAWQRAVEGVEQEFACGGEVRVRRRYADGLLRLLLQGSNPRKYGARPGFKRKRMLKYERKRMEREIRAEIEAARPPERSFDEAIDAIEDKLRAIGIPIRYDPPGYVDGDWITRGDASAGRADGAEAPGELGSALGDETVGGPSPRDSM
jgi:hypothetical protein